MAWSLQPHGLARPQYHLPLQSHGSGSSSSRPRRLQSRPCQAATGGTVTSLLRDAGGGAVVSTGGTVLTTGGTRRNVSDAPEPPPARAASKRDNDMRMAIDTARTWAQLRDVLHSLLDRLDAALVASLCARLPVLPALLSPRLDQGEHAVAAPGHSASSISCGDAGPSQARRQLTPQEAVQAAFTQQAGRRELAWQAGLEQLRAQLSSSSDSDVHPVGVSSSMTACDAGVEVQLAARQAVLDRLTEDVLPHHLRDMPSHGIVQVVEGLAGCGCVTETWLWCDVLNACDSRLASFTIAEIVRLLHCIASSSLPVRLSLTWLEGSERQARPRLREASVGQLAGLIGAWAALGFTPSEAFMSSFEAVTMRHLWSDAFSGDQLVQMLHSVSLLERHHPSSRWSNLLCVRLEAYLSPSGTAPSVSPLPSRSTVPAAQLSAAAWTSALVALAVLQRLPPSPAWALRVLDVIAHSAFPAASVPATRPARHNAPSRMSRAGQHLMKEAEALQTRLADAEDVRLLGRVPLTRQQASLSEEAAAAGRRLPGGRRVDLAAGGPLYRLRQLLLGEDDSSSTGGPLGSSAGVLGAAEMEAGLQSQELAMLLARGEVGAAQGSAAAVGRRVRNASSNSSSSRDIDGDSLRGGESTPALANGGLRGNRGRRGSRDEGTAVPSGLSDQPADPLRQDDDAASSRPAPTSLAPQGARSGGTGGTDAATASGTSGKQHVLQCLAAAQLAELAWAVGALDCVPPAGWLDAYLMEATGRLIERHAEERLELHHVVDIVSALPALTQEGRGASRDSSSRGATTAFLAAALPMLQHNMAGLPAPSLTGLVRALSRLRHAPDQGWWDALQDAVTGRLQTLAAADVADLLTGMALVGHRPHLEWLTLATRHVTRQRLASCPPAALSHLPCALALLGFKPTLGWLAALMDTVTKNVSLMRVGELSALLWALAVMKHRPSARFLQLFCQETQTRLHHLSPQELAGLAWALVGFQYRPDSAWVGRLVEAAVQYVQIAGHGGRLGGGTDRSEEGGDVVRVQWSAEQFATLLGALRTWEYEPQSEEVVHRLEAGLQQLLGGSPADPKLDVSGWDVQA